MTGAGHGWRRVGAALAATVCVAGLAGGFGQSSASPAPHIPKSAGTTKLITAAGAAPAAQLAKAGLLPNPKSVTNGVISLATIARDTAAKVNVRIPAVTGAAFLDPAYRTPANGLVRVPKYFLPAHPKAGCNYYEAVLYSDIYAVHLRVTDKHKPSTVLSVGNFPDAHVSALAFGSIPVTAVLHSHQVRRHGKLVPLTANTISAFSAVSQKDGSDCDPDWDNGAQTPPLGTTSRGELDVRVSDVRVDKQLVNVGPDCHTATPLQLKLNAGPKYILFTGGELIQNYNPATVDNGGTVYPLYPGSSNLTIPKFVDCRNPATGEDISRLLTSAVSGNSNTLAVNQSHAVLYTIAHGKISLCHQGQGCLKRPKFLNPPKPGMKVSR